MYADPWELGALVGVELDSDRAQLLLRLASAACDSAAAQVGATIAEVAGDQVTLDARGGGTLLLPGWPVTAVDAVTVLGGDGAGTLLRGPGEPDAQYAWSRAGALTRLGGCWPDRPQSVAVTFTHGWPAAEVPGPVKVVTLEVAGRGAGNPQLLGSINSDGTNASFVVREGTSTIPALGLTDRQTAMILRALR